MGLRSWCAACGSAGATVVALFACSSDDGGGGGRPRPPDGSTVLPDGAIVDPDGNVIGPDGDVIVPDAAKPSKVVVTTEHVTVAGGARDYVLSVPKTYDGARQYPLVIALHGDGQSADGFRVFLGLDEISGDDAIVAYPDQAVDIYTPYDQNPDQQLVEAVIDAVKGKRSIDAAKIWALGYSKGGFIANEIACRKPGLLKAMAAHAAGAPEEPRGGDGFPQCPGVTALPVMTSQGDGDTGIGAEFSAMYWASVNGCGAGRTATAPPGCQRFDGCPAAKSVTFCQAAGVSHYPIWAAAAQVSWDFFRGL